MTQNLTFALTRSQVRPNLRPEGNGRKFVLEIAERFSIPSDAGLSSGGSRQTFELVRLCDGVSSELLHQRAAPCCAERKELEVVIPAGFAVRVCERFLGKECPTRFVIGARCDAAAILPRALFLDRLTKIGGAA
jgi:hypothetical protein